MTVNKQVEVVLEGTFKGAAGMWKVHLGTKPQPIPMPIHKLANNSMRERTKLNL